MVTYLRFNSFTDHAIVIPCVFKFLSHSLYLSLLCFLLCNAVADDVWRVALVRFNSIYFFLTSSRTCDWVPHEWEVNSIYEPIVDNRKLILKANFNEDDFRAKLIMAQLISSVDWDRSLKIKFYALRLTLIGLTIDWTCLKFRDLFARKSLNYSEWISRETKSFSIDNLEMFTSNVLLFDW